MTQPRVTIAIPMYRSKRFLRVIRQNIRHLDLPDAEILLSDRHGDDDAMDMLQAEFGHDPRIRFLRASDRIGWVDHYNELLQQATGHYFMWMPHDDTFPRHYVPTLLADLERDSSIWLSFGTLYSVFRQPRRVEIGRLPNWQIPQHWSAWCGLRWFLFWNMGVPMRGLFDRERVLAQQLFLKSVPPANHYADIYWLFALALRGRMHYNPAAFTVKRMYATSTSGVWKYTEYFSRPGLRTLFQYVRETPLTPTIRYLFPGLLALYGCAYQLAAGTLFRWSPSVRQRILRLLFKQTRIPVVAKKQLTHHSAHTNRRFPLRPQSRL
jgi:GT2 family glycosyltransferase